MIKTKAALDSCSYPTPKTSTLRDEKIINDFDRATLAAGIIIMLSFGVMMLVGAWQAW